MVAPTHRLIRGGSALTTKHTVEDEIKYDPYFDSVYIADPGRGNKLVDLQMAISHLILYTGYIHSSPVRKRWTTPSMRLA